ncbi:MAG: tyrosine-type recombinase/integrase [Gemmatimonadales bacterium]
MRRLQAASSSEAERLRWVKMELALVLAEATGRRLSSIRQLRWEDIDLDTCEIRWRAEADKKGREWIAPLPDSLVEELRVFRRRLGAVAGWLFPGEHKPNQPMDRHLFDKWLTAAEQHADLPKLKGGLWHPYRRKWKTERKHHPPTDVAEAGGWKDLKTMLTSYDQPDRDTLLAVMSEPRKLRERSVLGAGST